MRTKKRTLLSVERLEDRWNPTFLSTFNPLSSTFTLTQTANSGDVQILVDGGGDLLINENSSGVTGITITSGGVYTVAPTTVTIAPPPTGTPATATGVVMGINSVTLATAGTGYAPGNVLTVGGPGGGTGATIVVNTIGAGGSIATFTLTNPGTGYTVSPPARTTTVAPVGGTGATFNIVNLRVVGVTGLVSGSGYFTPPAVTITGGAGAGATATAVITAASANLGPAGDNLKVNMLAGTSPLFITLDTGLVGSLTVQGNNGARSIGFDGGDNSIGGALTLSVGTGIQTIQLAANADLTVGRNATLNLGAGNDALEATNSINVAGNVYIYASTGNDTFTTDVDVSVDGSIILNGVNSVNVAGALTVGGNYTSTSTAEGVATSFSTGGATVGGNFTYYSGNRMDQVDLDGAVIDGTLYVSLGTNILGGDSLVDISGAIIGGNVNVNAGQTFVSGGNNYVSNDTTQVDGNIVVRFGTGVNNATFLGSIGGQFDTPHIVSYTGGSGADTVELNLVALNTVPGSEQTFQFIANLGAGADSFTLGPDNVTLVKLLVQFGLGTDVFVNNYGPFTFFAYFTGLS